MRQAVAVHSNRGGGVDMGKAPMLSVRVSPDILKRADRLVPKLAKDKSVTTIGNVSRSTVVKLALMRGLEALEAEYK